MSTKYLFYTNAFFLPLRILLSFVSSFIIYFRNKFYDLGIFKTYELDIPIISVGNISVGGSGKTILVQSLIQFFVEHDFHPAVLSRGYGRISKGAVLVSNGVDLLTSVQESGDEPFLIAVNFPGVPVMVSEDRVLGAQKLRSIPSVDLIILDDGFQHRRISRDLDIVLSDKPAGQKTRLLPWGDQREHSAGFNRASIIVYSKNGLIEGSENNLIIDQALYCYDHESNAHPLAEMTGGYGLFAGLGNPQSFFDSITPLLGAPQTTLTFDDHAKYTRSERDIISQTKSAFWLTTQKDFVKLKTSFCAANNIFYVKASAPLPQALRGLLKQHFKL